MSNEMQLKLIETYSLVCDLFDKNPQWNFIRLSNNHQSTQFTDQEAVTVYLFVGYYQKYSKIKEIHNFARHYLHEQYIQLELFTPVKVVNDIPECLKLRDFAYNNLFSAAVSKVRQPVESFFNWFIEKN